MPEPGLQGDLEPVPVLAAEPDRDGDRFLPPDPRGVAVVVEGQLVPVEGEQLPVEVEGEPGDPDRGVADDEFPGGEATIFGLAEDGVGIGEVAKPAEKYMDAVDEASKGITDGDIEVPEEL